MSSAHFIPHNGKQILLMDFCGAHTTAGISHMVEEMKPITQISLF